MSDIQTQLPVKLTNNTNTAAITSGNALQVDLGATTANSTAILVTGSGGTFPITGTVTANAGTGNFAVNIAQVAGSTVSTAATGIIKVGISDSSGSAITLGQTTMSASVPVVIASNQSNITVVGAGTAGTPSGGVFSVQGVSGGTPIPVATAVATATTGTITTSSSTVSVAITNYTAATVSVHGTYAGVNFAFNVSDDGGTTYYPVEATRLDGTGIETTTGVLTANQSRSWSVNFGGATNFQVAASAFTSGTANIRITPFDAFSLPDIQGTGVAGTPSGGVLSVQGVSGGTTLPISGTVTANAGTGTFTVSGTVTANAGTGNFAVNIAQVAGSTVSTAATGIIKVGVTDSAGTSITLGQKVMASSLPVVIASDQSSLSVTSGEVTTGIVTSYSTSAALANGSSATLTYTVTVGKTLYLKQIIAAASGGPCKVVVNYGSGPTVVAVGFFSTTAPYISYTFAVPPAIAASTAVNIVITNNAGASQDVYGTIIGHEQ